MMKGPLLLLDFSKVQDPKVLTAIVWHNGKAIVLVNISNLTLKKKINVAFTARL